VTLVKTVDATNTVTKTDVEKETIVIPTTIVSKYTTTEVIDNTLTKEREVETTIASGAHLGVHEAVQPFLIVQTDLHQLKSPTQSLTLPPSFALLRRLD
jgi:hypothetical protein